MDAVKHKINVETCRDVLKSRIGGRKPKMAIILGSGLSGLSDDMSDIVTVPYKDLPGFPEVKVQGHVGEAIIGKLNGHDILAFRGRQHFYETDDGYQVKTLVRTVKALGIEVLFISNAAGSLNKQIKPAELMMIKDHINMLGVNPLIGENDEAFGPRFLSMSNAWDSDLCAKLRGAAQKAGITLHEGVYLALRGPCFETPAEVRMARNLGGDAVGMSSVPECIVARHCGLKVVGCSCITNMGEGLSAEKLSHEHTILNATNASDSFKRLIAEFAGVL